MKGVTTCAVQGCGLPISEYDNLCNNHRLPGVIVTGYENSMVVTAWYAEHADEQGIILFNDWALGTMFGGRAGFEAELARQGFVNFRNLATPEELRAAKQSMAAKEARWSGPWLTIYPWEVN
jgi:hypothetical protein